MKFKFHNNKLCNYYMCFNGKDNYQLIFFNYNILNTVISKIISTPSYDIAIFVLFLSLVSFFSSIKTFRWEYFFLFIVIALIKFFRNKKRNNNGSKSKQYNPTKYKKSSLSNEVIMEIKNEIIDLFEKEKIFINSKLSLSSLAKELNISRHDVSQIINQGFNKNFYELVNYYRIEHIKEKLKRIKTKKVKFIDIAMESGFNSKSNFNEVFKKHTGCTPSNYMKMVKMSKK